MNWGQPDETSAYLHEMMRMELPKQLKRFVDSGRLDGEEYKKRKTKATLQEMGNGHKVCLLKKSLYGMEQAGRNWYDELNNGP